MIYRQKHKKVSFIISQNVLLTKRKSEQRGNLKIVAEESIVIICNDFNMLIYKNKTGGMKMELLYCRKGVYLFPNLIIESSKNFIGKYGMLWGTFLKEYWGNWYQSTMLTGKLDAHLMKIEKIAQERMKILVAELLQGYPTPDKEDASLV